MKKGRPFGDADSGQEKPWRMVQNPVIGQATIPETLLQAIAHGIATGLAYWLFGFEVALLLAIVIGVALVNMNVISSAVSSNVHLAEIRDFLSSRKLLQERDDD